MAKSLVIVESPAKAKTIQKYLGADFTVKASMGHVRDLPKKEMGVDIEHDFKPTYKALTDRSKVLKELKAAAGKATTVFLAPDPDREGEAIAWHIAQALKLSPEKARRVTFNEITRNAIRAAFENPGEIDMAKVNAQQARRILDRIVGYQLSPLLWKKVTKGLSAGRVQSVAVRLVVEREKEINAFTAEEFWRVTAKLVPAGSEKASDEFVAELAQWQDKPFKTAKGDEATAIADELRSAKYAVASVDSKEQRTSPGPAFNTSLLQQQASVLLRFNTKRTMRIAQQLYEGMEVGPEGAVGLITYMRTDSFRISPDALAETHSFIKKEFGEKYASPKVRVFKARKGAQEAHEAIRPTSVLRTPASVKPYLSPEQFRLYELIWTRFVATQMADATYHVTDVAIRAGKGLFKAKGRVCTFDGHTRLTGYREEKEVQDLPPLNVEQALNLIDLKPSQHFTKPPGRYTEASLVRALEKAGIGRPSTYAAIISTIQARGYVRQEKRALFATELGIGVTDLLIDGFPRLMDVKFTSGMEEKLDKIEEEHRDWVAVLKEFYNVFHADLEKAQTGMKSLKGAEVAGETCPKCGKPLLERWSKYGKFLGCSGYPTCKYIKSDKAEVVSDVVCAKCGKPMVVKRGRGGSFLGCSGYPDCKSTLKLGRDGKPVPPPEPTDQVCEKCGSPMLIRTSARGRFLACSGFPKCRNAKPLPSGVKCPREGCGGDVIYRRGRGRRKGFFACTNYPKCDYTASELPQPDAK